MFSDNSYIGSAVVLIVLGAIIMVVAFFGCCGACTENPCMMYTYGTLLALILIALIGVTVTIVVFKVSIINKLFSIFNCICQKGISNHFFLFRVNIFFLLAKVGKWLNADKKIL